MTNNDKTKRLKKEKFIAGTALILGMTAFGVTGHADGVTVGSSSDASSAITNSSDASSSTGSSSSSSSSSSHTETDSEANSSDLTGDE